MTLLQRSLSLFILWMCCVIESFSSWSDSGTSLYTTSFRWPQRKNGLRVQVGRVWRPDKIGFQADHPVTKVSRQPVVSDVLSTAANAHFEFIQDGDVSLRGYRLTISIIVLKEKRPDDSLTAHSGPDSYLFRMQLFTDTRFYPILYLLLKSLL